MKIYLSPSTQEHNPYADGKTVEEIPMNKIADVVIRELAKTKAFEIFRNKPTMTLTEFIADSNKRVGKGGLHVAIHSNASPVAHKGQVRGCSVYAYAPNTNSYKLAQALYNQVAPLTPTSDNGVKYSSSISEVMKTKATTALIEIAYHDNPEDAKWILANIDNIGLAIAHGICTYTGTPLFASVPVVTPKPTNTPLVSQTSPIGLKKPPYIVHIVVKGESYYAIGRKYGVSWLKLMKDNGTINPFLKIGQALKIFVASPKPIVTPPKPIVTPKPSYVSYTVVKGDSLWKIGKKYNVSIFKIAKDNKINVFGILSIGKVLKIYK